MAGLVEEAISIIRARSIACRVRLARLMLSAKSGMLKLLEGMAWIGVAGPACSEEVSVWECMDWNGMDIANRSGLHMPGAQNGFDIRTAMTVDEYDDFPCSPSTSCALRLSGSIHHWVMGNAVI
jgi:hypothetical protein